MSKKSMNYTFFIFFLFNFIFCFNEVCEKRDSCFSCLSNSNCTWCVRDSKCVEKNKQKCSIFSKTTWTNFKRGEEWAQKKNISFFEVEHKKCDLTKSVFTKIEECPDFQLFIESDYEANVYKAKFYAYPIDPSIRMTLKQTNLENPIILINKTYISLINTKLGLFYTNGYSSSLDLEDSNMTQPLVFSYISDVLGDPLLFGSFVSSYAVSDRLKYVATTDLALKSVPADYSFGVVVSIQISLNETICLFAKSKNSLNIQNFFFSFFLSSSSLIFIFIPFFILIFQFFCVIIIHSFDFCKYEKRNFHKKSLKIKTPTKSIQKYFNNFREIIFSVFFHARSEDILKNCGAEGFLFLKFKEAMLFTFFLFSLVSSFFFILNSIFGLSLPYNWNSPLDVAVTTTASISFDSSLIAFHSSGMILNVLIAVIFLYLVFFISKIDLPTEKSIKIQMEGLNCENFCCDVTEYDNNFFYDVILLNNFPKIDSKNRNAIILNILQNYYGVQNVLEVSILNETGIGLVRFKNANFAENFIEDLSVKKLNQKIFFDLVKMIDQNEKNSLKIIDKIYGEHYFDLRLMNWKNLNQSNWRKLIFWVLSFFIVFIILNIAGVFGLISQAVGVTYSYFLNCLNLLIEFLIGNLLESENDVQLYNRNKFVSFIGRFDVVYQIVGVFFTIFNGICTPIAKFFVKLERTRNKIVEYQREILIGSVVIFLNGFVYGRIFFQILFLQVGSKTDSQIYQMTIDSFETILNCFGMLFFYKLGETLFFVLAPFLFLNKCSFKNYIPTSYPASYSLNMFFFVWCFYFNINHPIFMILSFFGFYFSYLIDRLLIFYVYKKENIPYPSNIVLINCYVIFAFIFLYPFSFVLQNMFFNKTIIIIFSLVCILIGLCNILVFSFLKNYLKFSKFKIFDIEKFEKENKFLIINEI